MEALALRLSSVSRVVVRVRVILMDNYGLIPLCLIYYFNVALFFLIHMGAKLVAKSGAK